MNCGVKEALLWRFSCALVTTAQIFDYRTYFRLSLPVGYGEETADISDYLFYLFYNIELLFQLFQYEMISPRTNKL